MLNSNLTYNDIVVGFSTTNHVLSKIIRVVTRSKASHAWIGFYDKTLGMHMVMQAELFGFEVVPFKRWKRSNTIVSVFTSETLNLTGGLKYLACSVGLDYDFKSALLVGLKRWFSKLINKPKDSPSKLMCSEAVSRMLEFSGAKCIGPFNHETVSPGQLMDVLKCSDNFIEIDEEFLYSCWG
jgi:hypothetical protein